MTKKQQGTTEKGGRGIEKGRERESGGLRKEKGERGRAMRLRVGEAKS